jgi:ADP-ribose pyrophosphatase YjhB (NUDIX family)
MKKFIKTLFRESINQMKVAGVLINCEETNRVLLLLRNDELPTWSLVSGVMENDENAIECLKREIKEELSINSDLIKLNKVNVEMFNDKNMEFHYYKGNVKKEFLPKLNSENID